VAEYARFFPHFVTFFVMQLVSLTRLSLASVLLLGYSIAPATAANALGDPGFEQTPATTQPILGWTSYGPNTYVESDPTHAHAGSNYFKVYGAFSGTDNYAGVSQDLSTGPGAVFNAQAWAFSLAGDTIHGADQVWVEVTFRDAAANTLALFRSDIITGTNLAAYGGPSVWFLLPVTHQWAFYNSGGVPVGTSITNNTTALVAPAGTAFVRYQLVFHQGPNNDNGSAYLDDCALIQLSGPTNSVPAWNIVWSDEFNGSAINASAWSFEGGNNNGWGNNELEYYTNRPQNAYVSNGLLHMVALKDPTLNYTSVRMKTQGHFSKAYGRFEFRAKLPPGLGFWPAFWLLGANITSVGWPACGEIDVMENKGNILDQVQGTIHYSDAANNHLQSTDICTLTDPGAVTNFHSYMLEWNTNLIRWYVDGLLYESQSNWSSSTGPYPAPFNQPFFIIMNLAVGGNYVGNPSIATINANSTFPADLQVDYVRVWDLTAPLEISFRHTGGNVLLNWPTNIVCHLQSQTNSLSVAGAWTDVAGAASPYTVRPGANQAIFYRLESP
jgi:beta-glucanase (GH16 family)